MSEAAFRILAPQKNPKEQMKEALKEGKDCKGVEKTGRVR